MKKTKLPKQDKRSPESPTRGRPRKPAGSVRSISARGYLLPSERPAVEEAARARHLSVSDLVRAGLRSLGVHLIDQEYREPFHD